MPVNGRGLYILLVKCPPAPGRDPQHSLSYVKSIHGQLCCSSTSSTFFVEDRRRLAKSKRPRGNFLQPSASDRLSGFSIAASGHRNERLVRASPTVKRCSLRASRPAGPATVESMADRACRRSLNRDSRDQYRRQSASPMPRGHDPQAPSRKGETFRTG